jgi:guanyl-specific ribonuclease Sa
MRIPPLGLALPFLLAACTGSPAPRPDPAESRHQAPAEKKAAPSGLTSTGDAARDSQIARVVRSFDETGEPPRGVVQGGRKGRARGVFQNAEGRLPARPSGYYEESDLWPKGKGRRGPERLILGREGEVWFSPDHYRTFDRLR